MGCKKCSLMLMKRIASIALITCIAISFLITSAGAENTIVYKQEFSDGFVLDTPYSDQPAGFNASLHTQFKNENGKMVYDTTPQILAGTVYPSITPTAGASYPRANYNYVINDAKDAKYLYQSEISFEREFFETGFSLRYGASTWQNSITNDVLLYEITDAGVLKFGTKTTNLTLGQTYNISVLVDLSNDPTFYRSLYIDGQLEHENEATAIGGSGGSTPSRVFSASHILRPYTNPAPFTYKDTKFSVDNVKITKVTEEYSILGEASVFIPKKTAEQEFNYSFVDMFFGSTDPTWSVAPENAGVTVDSTGKLTVANTATAGAYTLTAGINGNNIQKAITVSELVYNYTIFGDDKISILSGSGTKQYNYVLKDQFSEEESCNYSILETGSRLSITNNGILSVPENTSDGNYTIIAKSLDNETELARKTIEISHITYSILGNGSLYYPANGGISEVEYILSDNLGVKYPNAVWKQVGNVAGVNVQSDGIVYIDSSIMAASFQLQATLNNATVTRTITLTKGVLFSFDNDTVGMPPAGWGSFPALVAEKDGNKFLDATSAAAARNYLPTNYGMSVTTLKFNTMITDANPATQGVIQLATATQGTDTGKWYFGMPVLKSGNIATINAFNSMLIANVEIGKWVEIKCVIDFDNYRFDIYADNVLKIIDAPLPADMTDFKLATLIVTSALDNVSIHSGRELSRTINIVNSSDMFLPEAGNISEVLLKADVKVDGVSMQNPAVEWSLNAPYSGISISGNKLIISNALPGSFSLTAKISGTEISAAKTFNLAVPDVFPKIDGTTLNLTSTPNTMINISIFGSSDTSTLINKFSNEFSSTSTVTTTVTTDSSGRASHSLSGLQAGRYNIAVNKTSGAAVNTEYVCKAGELLSDINNVNNEKFKEYLSEFSNLSAAAVNDAYDTYKGLTNKSLALTLSQGDFNKFFVSSLLTKVSEAQSSDSSLNTKVAAELSKISVSSAAIELLGRVTNYTEVLASTAGAVSIDNFLNKLLEKEILYEIEHSANVRDPKAFLAALGNTKYNGATESQRNYICEQVVNKIYADLTALNTAINALTLPVEPGPGGTTGGGGVRGGVSTGTVSNNYMTQPVLPSQNAFFDVAIDHWAYSFIEKMQSRNIMTGYENNFRPDDKITRAELLKTLIEAYSVSGAEESDFSDVSASDWYAKYIGIASNNGLVTGYDGMFYPNDYVTRQDALVMIYRFSKYAGASFSDDELTYIDADQINDYAYEAVKAISAAGIIGGYEDNSIKPLGNLTRAETAKIIYGGLAIKD